MAKQFKTLQELEIFLKKGIMDALGDEVVQEVKEVEIEVIRSTVYGAYPNPKQYQRREGNGGLLDIRNIRHYPLFNGFFYSIVNETQKNQRPEYLAPLIEYGHQQAVAMGDVGYEYPRYGMPYMRPRPFTQNTVDRLNTTKEHVTAMKQGLEKRGIDVK
jgi:hypothetical protein